MTSRLWIFFARAVYRLLLPALRRSCRGIISYTSRGCWPCLASHVLILQTDKKKGAVLYLWNWYHLSAFRLLSSWAEITKWDWSSISDDSRNTLWTGGLLINLKTMGSELKSQDRYIRCAANGPRFHVDPQRHLGLDRASDLQMSNEWEICMLQRNPLRSSY